MTGNKTCIVGDINNEDYEIFFEDQRSRIPRMENIDIPIPEELDKEILDIPRVECNRKHFHIGKFVIW